MVEKPARPGASLAPLSAPVSEEAEAVFLRLAAALASRSIALHHRIGEGAMGEVWAGERGDEPVVVKVMRGHVPPDNRDRMRFEGQALQRIRSRNVVRVLDWGIWEDRPYLVLERLEGRDLKAVLADGPVAWREALGIAIDVLRGLGATHAAKILHRDIKPANIFLTPGERGAVLLDFGVAKLLQRVTGIDPIEKATRIGTAVGTPRYISPEQACAHPVDHRADLYSLGVVLFALLTGEPLFRARTLSALLVAHVTEAPRPPSALVPGLPPALDDAVLRALAKHPDDRYPDADAFRRALEAVRDAAHPGAATPDEPRDDTATALVAAGAITGRSGTDIIAPPLLAATEIAPPPVVVGGARPAPRGGTEMVATPKLDPATVKMRAPVTAPMPSPPATSAAKTTEGHTTLEPTLDDAPALRMTEAASLDGSLAGDAHGARGVERERRSARTALLIVLAAALFALALAWALAMTEGP